VQPEIAADVCRSESSSASVHLTITAYFLCNALFVVNAVCPKVWYFGRKGGFDR
jgi:hypothetical protein